MKWFWLCLLPGGAVGLAVIVGVRWWRGRDNCVSANWLIEQDRRDETSGIDGVAWKFPVNKILNDAGLFNAKRLRKRA